MSQTRKGSFIEAVTNVLIGFGVNYTANLIVLPMFGMHVGLLDNLYIGIIYTTISIVRSYVIRRFFNSHIDNTTDYRMDSYEKQKVS